MRQRRRHTPKNVPDSRDRPYHSRRCFRGRVALSERRWAEPPVYKVGLVGGKGYTSTHGGGSVRQQRHCVAKNVRNSSTRPYHTRRCFRGGVALSVHRRAKPPVYKVGLVGGKGYATH